MTPSPWPHLLIVGGGHASLPLLADARRLAAATGATVTLVSDRPVLWYSGMVPEWLGGVYTEADVTVPLVPLCRREGVRFVEATAVGLDPAARSLTLDDSRQLGYDVLAVDIGAVNPGREGAGEAISAKPLWHIADLGHFLDETASGRAARRLVIVGGGAAGTEIALNVTARLGLARLAVTLVEPGERLCPELPRRLGRWAADVLRQRGASARLGVAAEATGPDGVRLDSGETLPADAVLWATGSTGPPLLRAAGLPVTRRGFARVDRGLRSATDPRVFVAGDAAAVAGHEGLARIGVHAVKQGPVLRENVGRTLAALAAGVDLAEVEFRAFRPYPVAPLLLSTGADTAWWTAGGVAVRGRPLLRLKHAVDRRWIDRYRDEGSYPGRWDAAHAGGRG